MMKKIFFLGALTVIVLSCNSGSDETPAEPGAGDTSKPADNKMPATVACFAGITGKDTVKLEININDSIVKGNLSYKRYEKDSNTGTIEGILKGDTLLADYTFMSEGQQSAREIIFLIKDSIAIEGYGDMEEKNGKMIFKNPSQIPFEKGGALRKVACE